MTWVDAIADLYHQNGLRLQADPDSALYVAHHARLQQYAHDLATRRDEALADPRLARPAAQVLQSMQNHWSGLTVFVEHPWVPMDNNRAYAACGIAEIMPTPGLCRAPRTDRQISGESRLLVI